MLSITETIPVYPSFCGPDGGAPGWVPAASAWKPIFMPYGCETCGEGGMRTIVWQSIDPNYRGTFFAVTGPEVEADTKGLSVVALQTTELRSLVSDNPIAFTRGLNKGDRVAFLGPAISVFRSIDEKMRPRNLKSTAEVSFALPLRHASISRYKLLHLTGEGGRSAWVEMDLPSNDVKFAAKYGTIKTNRPAVGNIRLGSGCG